MGFLSNIEPDEPEPDTSVISYAHAFYADSFSEAMRAAAGYLETLEVDTSNTEPILRLTHYPSYEKPFTCTLVVPVGDDPDENLLNEN
jgi:hypothetical protein